MRLSYRVRPLLLVMMAAACLWAADRPAVSPERLQQHVNYLASPQMKGRATGSPELKRASEYIASDFRKVGLQPGNGKSYFQEFRVTVGAELGKQNRLAFTGSPGAQAKHYTLSETFVPLNFSETGEASLPLVFAGYGITAPEYNYDDYSHLDVAGKAVIVLRNEPQKDDANSKFEGKQPTQHSSQINKAINARNHGAKAMILVNDEPGPGEEDLLVKFGTLTGPENAGILLIHAKRSVVDEWLAADGKNLSQLQKEIEQKLESQSFALKGGPVSVSVDVRKQMAQTRNVVGVLRGSDSKLAEEAIVIGAHYDHLGLGQQNSLAPSQVGQVHPGADDNASGTAVMMELARELVARRIELKRSIVFLAFSGEELGLLGSAHYTKNPTWPLEKIAAMVNLDMVGRPRDNKIFVGGVGTSPAFKEILARANTTGLALSESQDGYGSSDHQSFYVKNLPVLFFFSGLHADYHKPSDTPEKFQAAEAARVGDLAMRTVIELARMGEKPQFVRVQQPSVPAMGGAGGGYGAYFGSIPDMGEEVKGVRFSDVRDGSPAAQAGLKAGDILIEFAGKEIQNLYDFTYALRTHRPGEEVEVTVLRDGKPLKVKVTLAQRR